MHPKLGLIDQFQNLSDPRVQGRIEHDLNNVLVIAADTLLCGSADFGRAKEAWCKTSLTLRNGIPSREEFNRVFAALKRAAVLDCFLRWTARRCSGPHARASRPLQCQCEGAKRRRGAGPSQGVRHLP